MLTFLLRNMFLGYGLSWAKSVYFSSSSTLRFVQLLNSEFVNVNKSTCSGTVTTESQHCVLDQLSISVQAFIGLSRASL